MDIGNIASGFLAELATKSGAAPSPGDYTGEDGRLYCGRCHTPKEVKVKFRNLPGRTFRCMCKCEEAELKRREERDAFDERMRSLNRLRDASMMDSKYREASLKSYVVTDKNRKIKSLAEKYVANFSQMYSENQGLVFYGHVGSGKSYTAACIANELLAQNIPVIMTSFVKIMQNIMNSNESEYIAMLNSAKLLIIDDLGAERSTDYALEKVYNIVDSRLRVSRPMILTTNLELADMMNTADIRYKRIYDRILEVCFPVQFTDLSFREGTAHNRYMRMQKFMEG